MAKNLKSPIINIVWSLSHGFEGRLLHSTDFILKIIKNFLREIKFKKIFNSVIIEFL